MSPTDLTHPSPNHKPRPAGAVPRVLILHGSTGTDKSDLKWCAMNAAAMKTLWDKTNPKKRPEKPWKPVSYHGLILRNGDWCRMVDFSEQAYHAGESAWNGLSPLNPHSIGIAYSNRCDGVEALTAQQIAVMLGVIEGLARSLVTLEAVVTHKMVSPGRKYDPENCLGFGWPECEAAFARGVRARQRPETD